MKTLATPGTIAREKSIKSMASSSLPNGQHAELNGESSKIGNQSEMNGPEINHSLGLADFIFNVGYLGQNWADIHISFFDTGIKAHRIVLARSPYLLRQIMPVQTGSSIHLSFDDETINAESVHIALQHLYRPALTLVHPGNVRAVLSTAVLFDGMPELAHHAYTVLRDSINAESAIGLANWASSSSQHHAIGSEESSGKEGRYGEWSSRIQADVDEYLVRTLPEQVSEPDLATAYSQLPFDLFKQYVESNDLPIGSTQKRFTFAKKVIAIRKKAAGTTQMEEAAVLAMQGDGMAVVVTRKAKKGRNFFKVEG